MMKRRLALLFSTAGISLMLAACGQKGPLYLPGDPSEIRTEIPPQPGGPEAPAPEESGPRNDSDNDGETDSGDDGGADDAPEDDDR